MKLDDMRISDQMCVFPMQEKHYICIIINININKGFECFQIFTRDCTNYFISLTDDQIEDQDPVPESILKDANDIIEPYGGIDNIINLTQSLYNDTIEKEKSLGYDDHFYENLGKDNIRSYITKTSLL